MSTPGAVSEFVASVHEYMRVTGKLNKVPPPASLELVEEAEQALGFPLPPLLRELYLNVSNGGYGPGYGGLVGLRGGVRDEVFEESLVEIYRICTNPPPRTRNRWPEKVLPIIDGGCSIKLCVDCNSEPNTIIGYDPNQDTWKEMFWVVSPSLQLWLQEWMDEGK